LRHKQIEHFINVALRYCQKKDRNTFHLSSEFRTYDNTKECCVPGLEIFGVEKDRDRVRG
jgi:hypothetical protein